MTQSYIMPGAEPYFLPGNPVGCLMIHGFTGTPKELRWMGEYLSNNGFTVYGIRLAGHATKMSDLIRAHWQDWLISVEEGIDLLKVTCKSIFIAGLSMGGILALLAAAQYDIQGIIVMSTPFALPNDWRLSFAHPLSIFYPFVKKEISNMKNEEAAREHLEYPFYPTRAISEVHKLIIQMQTCLPKIKIPALIIHSKADDLSFENAKRIHECIGSEDKEIFLLEKSGHVITEDIERSQVFEKAKYFIKRISKNQ